MDTLFLEAAVSRIRSVRPLITSEVTAFANELLAVETLEAGLYDDIVKDHHKGYLQLIPYIRRVNRHGAEWG